MKLNISALLRRCLPTPSLPAARQRQRRRASLFRTEPLEVRTLLAGVSDADSTLTIDLHEADALSVIADGDAYRLQLSSGSFTDDGVTSAAVAGWGTQTLTVDINNSYSTIQITDSGTGASVVFGNSTRSFADHFDVNLSGEVAADQAVRIEGAIDFGDFNFSVVSDRTIHMPGGGAVTVNNGNLTFDGHNVGDAAGMITGIFLCGGNITSTGTGDITLRGTATSAGPNLDYHIGVDIRDGSLVTSAGTGDILIQGTGGAGASWNNGVLLFDGASIETAAGGIRIEGVAGSGTGRNNVGLALAESGPIRSTATGDGAAPVILSGTGGEGTSYNHGVMMYGVTSAILVEHGDLLVHGISGVGTDEFNAGINFYEFDRIQSNGVAGGVGQILLDGISKSSSTESTGVILSGAGSQVIAANHDLKMSGRAGQKTNGDMAGNGVHLHTDLVIQANGSVESPTHIIFDGHGTSGVVVANGVSVTAHSTDVSFHSSGQSVGSSFAGSLSVSGPGREVLISDRGTGNYRTTVAGRIEANEGAIHIQSAAEDAAEPQIWVTAQQISASVITIATAGSVRLLNTLFQSSVVRVGPYQKLGSAPVTPHSIQFFTSSGESRISATHGIQMTASHDLEIYSPLITTTGDIALQVTPLDGGHSNGLNVGSILQTDSGNVHLSGTTTAGRNSNYGVRLNYAQIITNSGNIDIQGTFSGLDDPRETYGVALISANVSSDTGLITIAGSNLNQQNDAYGVRAQGSAINSPAIVQTDNQIIISGQTDFPETRAISVGAYQELGRRGGTTGLTLQSSGQIFFEDDIPESQTPPVINGSGELKIITSATDATIGLGSEATVWVSQSFLDRYVNGRGPLALAATDDRPVDVKIAQATINVPLRVEGNLDVLENALVTSMWEGGSDALFEVTGVADIHSSASLTLSVGKSWRPGLAEQMVILDRQQGTGTFTGWADGSIRPELGNAVVQATDGGQRIQLKFPAEFYFAFPSSLDSSNPQFFWSSVAAAASYDVWLAAAGEGQPIVDEAVESPWYEMDTTLPLGAYNLYVRPVLPDGSKGQWSGRAVRVDEATILDASVSRDALSFQWDAVPGAAQYRLYIQNLMTGHVVHDSLQQETNFEFRDPDEGRYRAWVQAVNSKGFRGRWSAPEDLHLGPALIRANLNAFHSWPEIAWQPSHNAAHYQIWIQRQGQVVLNETEKEATTWRPDTDAEDGEYHYWIRPTNHDGSVGAWSERGVIRIGGRTDIVEASRSDEFSLDLIRWSPVESAAAFEVFQQSSDGTVFRKTVSHEESSLQLASVQAGQTNYWVRAQDEQGNWGPWSQSQSSFSPDASFNFPVVPETTFVSGIPGESLSLNWNHGDGLSYYVTGLDENGSVTYTAHRATASIELSSEDLNGQGSIYIRSANDSGELSPVSPQVHFNFSGKTVVTSATEAGHPGPVIDWVAVQGSGVVYQLQVQHVDTQEVVIREEALSENSFTPPDDLIAGTYRAWVRVLADGFSGPWSAAYEFVVG